MLLDVFHESRTNIMLGAKGSGKTNFTAVLMRDLTAYGFDIYTNIHFFSHDEVPIACNRGKLPKGVTYQPVPSQIHVVPRLSDLLYGLLKPGRKAVFIDEAGIVSPTGTSKDTKQMKQLAYIIRHFDCAFTIITQIAGSVPPDLREHLIDYRLKVYRDRRYRFVDIGSREVAVDEFGEDYIAFPLRKTLGPIPLAELPYDGDFPSAFELNIKLKEAMDRFGKLKSSIEVEQKGKAVIDRLLGQQRTKKDAIREFRAENPRMSVKRVAKHFNTTVPYVKRIGND